MTKTAAATDASGISTFYVIVAIAVSCFFSIGCVDKKLDVNSGDTPVAIPGSDARMTFNGRVMKPADSAHPLDPSQQVVSINAAVMEINVPVGSVSRTERLWRYLDEQVGLESDMAAMNHNGFRIAVASVDSWPKISSVLRQMTGKALNTVNHVALVDKPLEVEMATNRPPSRIFYFDQAGRLSGRDYPAGDYIFSLNFRINTDSPGGVLLHMAPQVRTKPKMRIIRGEFQLRKANVSDYYNIADLEITVEIPQDHFVVIGPGAASARSTSAAGEFLNLRKKGLGLEKVMVIVPKVYVSELGGNSVE